MGSTGVIGVPGAVCPGVGVMVVGAVGVVTVVPEPLLAPLPAAVAIAPASTVTPLLTAPCAAPLADDWAIAAA